MILSGHSVNLCDQYILNADGIEKFLHQISTSPDNFEQSSKDLAQYFQISGIIPLYWGTDTEGRLYIASEQKCLVDICEVVEIFPPRMYYHGPPKMGKLKQWYFMDWTPQVSMFMLLVW